MSKTNQPSFAEVVITAQQLISDEIKHSDTSSFDVLHSFAIANECNLIIGITSKKGDFTLLDIK